MSEKLSKKLQLKMPKLVVLPVVAVVLLGFIAAGLWLLPHGQRIDSSKYQVVYLSSGQAYFGKLQNTGGDYLELRNPYVVQDVQQPTDSTKGQTNQTTLVKVSDQVYGPDDSMSLRSDNVLFWQNLREDSKVAQAIDAKQ